MDSIAFINAIEVAAAQVAWVPPRTINAGWPNSQLGKRILTGIGLSLAVIAAALAIVMPDSLEIFATAVIQEMIWAPDIKMHYFLCCMIEHQIIDFNYFTLGGNQFQIFGMIIVKQALWNCIYVLLLYEYAIVKYHL
ncbi:hypothetical protein ACJX0J_010257 [Zea mays]